MAKANRRLRSVVEGAVEATKDARRVAAAEKIRASVTTPPTTAATGASPTPAAPASPPVTPKPAASPPPKPARKPRPAKPKPVEPAVEPDTQLDATPEQRVPVPAPAARSARARRVRDTTEEPTKPTQPPAENPRPKPVAAEPPTNSGGFAPIRGPGALLGRLLKEGYRQTPNILANAVAIPAFTAAGAGGVYLGTAATVAAIRGISKLLAPEQAEQKSEQAPTLPAPAAPPDDYRSGFQRAIDERRKPRATDSSFDVIRALSRPRGLS